MRSRCFNNSHTTLFALQWSGPRWEGFKLVGDVNVPSGQHTFMADLTRAKIGRCVLCCAALCCAVLRFIYSVGLIRSVCRVHHALLRSILNPTVLMSCTLRVYSLHALRVYWLHAEVACECRCKANMVRHASSSIVIFDFLCVSTCVCRYDGRDVLNDEEDPRPVREL